MIYQREELTKSLWVKISFWFCKGANIISVFCLFFLWEKHDFHHCKFYFLFLLDVRPLTTHSININLTNICHTLIKFVQICYCVYQNQSWFEWMVRRRSCSGGKSWFSHNKHTKYRNYVRSLAESETNFDPQ